MLKVTPELFAQANAVIANANQQLTDIANGQALFKITITVAPQKYATGKQAQLQAAAGIVCRYYNLPADELFCLKTKNEYGMARKMFWLLAYNLKLANVHTIARFSGREHCTVWTSNKLLRQAMKYLESLQHEYNELEKMIKENYAR